MNWKRLYLEDDQVAEPPAEEPKSYNGRSFKTLLKKYGSLYVFSKLQTIGSEGWRYTDYVSNVNSSRSGAGIDLQLQSTNTLHIQSMGDFWISSVRIATWSDDKGMNFHLYLKKTEGYGWRQTTSTCHYKYEFEFNKMKVSVQDNKTIISVNAEIYKEVYSRFERINGKKNLIFTFNGNIFEKTSKKNVNIQKFNTEIKSEITRIADDELGSWDGESSYSFNQETKTAVIRYNGYGKASGDGYSYFADCQLKFYGGKWKIVKSGIEDDTSRMMNHEDSATKVPLKICNALLPIYEKYKQKVPKFMKIHLYVERD